MVPPLCQQLQSELFTSLPDVNRDGLAYDIVAQVIAQSPKPPKRRKHAKPPEFVYPPVGHGRGPASMPVIEVKLRVERGGNNREHWTAALRRKTKEREAVRAMLLLQRFLPLTPCRVVLTRLGPSNGLDDDNLAGSLKSVRDEVAAWLGVDDRHREVVRYEYEQARTKEWAVRISFKEMA